MEKENKLSIYRVNLLFLILAIIFLSIGAFIQNFNFFFGILVTEILILVVPNIWFVKMENISLRKVFRFNKIGFKNIVLIVFITILTYPIAAFAQGLFITIFDAFIPLQPNPLPEVISQIPFLWSIFFIAIVPGICEEIMFRGTVLKAYEKLGMKKAIIISALLFGMFHFTLINFVGPAVLGIVFGIMVYRTNSIYSSIIAHSLNNFIALVINYFVIKNMDFINNMSAQEVDLNPSFADTMMSFAILGVFIIILFKIVKILLNKLSPALEEDLEDIETEDIETEDIYVENMSIEKEQITVFTYSPLIVVAIMFLIFNFMFIFR